MSIEGSIWLTNNTSESLTTRRESYLVVSVLAIPQMGGFESLIGTIASLKHWLKQFQLQGTCDGFGPPLHAKLGKNVLVVPLDGAQGHKQALADLLI